MGRNCFTCRYKDVSGLTHPCKDCKDDDLEMWEPKEEDVCIDPFKSADNVNSPAHYKAFPVEVFEIIKFVLERSELPPFESWCLGNEIKYRLRAGLKDKNKIVEDIMKAEKLRTWRTIEGL